MLIRYNITAAQPITRLEFDFENGENPQVVTFPVTVGSDGRYFHAQAPKPTINGVWPLVVTAEDVNGRRGVTRCLWVTVTF